MAAVRIGVSAEVAGLLLALTSRGCLAARLRRAASSTVLRLLLAANVAVIVATLVHLLLSTVLSSDAGHAVVSIATTTARLLMLFAETLAIDKLMPFANKRISDEGVAPIVRGAAQLPATKAIAQHRAPETADAAVAIAAELAVLLKIIPAATVVMQMPRTSTRSGTTHLHEWPHDLAALPATHMRNMPSSVFWAIGLRDMHARVQRISGHRRDLLRHKVCVAAEALPLGDPSEACPLTAKSGPLLLMRTLVVDHKLVTPSRLLNCVWSAAIMDVAARNGHIDIVRVLHEHRTEGSAHLAMDRAAERGHLAIVQCLHTHRSEGCTTAAMDSASAGGHLDVVGFLHERRTEDCTLATTDMAAAAGLIDAMACLRSHRTEGRTAKATDIAAMLGRIVVLQ
ncbi:hypothetical protein HK105_202789 [Polyrhizophydium stewartii]|uniref:Ankyrin repeat protein n=1 Tax=Polyrhizophydium stewartii TaxID=2732419 RepID=A0ABR4ND95_9FUNG